VSLLRQIEVAVANGKTTPVACRENGITEQTYYRCRKEHGGLQVDQARRLKELEQENSKLKSLVSELSLEKLVLKGIASGNPLSPSRLRNWKIAWERNSLEQIPRECISSALSKRNPYWPPRVQRCKRSFNSPMMLRSSRPCAGRVPACSTARWHPTACALL
jgi:putative transposase